MIRLSRSLVHGLAALVIALATMSFECGPPGRDIPCTDQVVEGDVLHVDATAKLPSVRALPASLVPRYGNEWTIAVLYGPHGAPDFFTPDDIATFFSTAWEVHYNSSRTGVRLIGPKPQWARTDGGEAGLHPSNIHDNAYAIGAIDFTGDMPVILGPDGPSLGGFVCPATIVQSELWKTGQLRPGDRVRFHCISATEGARREQMQAKVIAKFAATCPDVTTIHLQAGMATTPILAAQPADEERVAVVYRQAGDRNILVEFGPPVLDLNLRFRVHALMVWLQQADLAGIVDLTPGIRSLQVHYDSNVISQSQLMDVLLAAEEELPACLLYTSDAADE